MSRCRPTSTLQYRCTIFLGIPRGIQLLRGTMTMVALGTVTIADPQDVVPSRAAVALSKTNIGPVATKHARPTGDGKAGLTTGEVIG